MPEQKPGGYTGRILRVNLSNKSISVDENDDNFYRRYYGGTALIGYYLLKELKPGIDPLGPENKLIFSAGVITGIPCAGGGRSGVGSKSPLTNAWGDAQAGGFWPAELKRAGWDAIIIEDKADSPVYLWINDDKVEIRDASHLWGKDTLDAERQIQEELGDKRIRVAQIGPGGENLVRFAGIANDLIHYYGRNGHGAVMGSKMLKAIAVRGHRTLHLAYPEKVRAIAKKYADSLKENPHGMTANGTAAGVPSLNESSILPTRNFQEGQFEGFMDIAGETMTNTILVGRDNCYACPIYCKRQVKVGPPYNVDPVYGGPEYETIGALGSFCGVNDLKAVALGNQLCNAYGLDTIGAGVSIAFAMECYERGILTKEDTNGIDLKFGNAEAMTTMITKIAKREGLGNTLAEGVKRAAEQIGKGSMEYAMHIKGQELPMHDPRGKNALGLGYTVSPTGADHMHNIHDTMFANEGKNLDDMKTMGILEPIPSIDLGPAKIRLFYYYVNWRYLQNSALICMFPPFNMNEVAELVASSTGWNTSVFELIKVGERAHALARAFNAREGYTAKDDVLPDRFYQNFKTGPLKDTPYTKEGMDRAQKLYYQMAGWDPELAVPTEGKLYELDLGWVADELKASLKK